MELESAPKLTERNWVESVKASIERLMAFLTSFDRDVDIVVRPHKKSGKAGRITFSSAE